MTTVCHELKIKINPINSVHLLKNKNKHTHLFLRGLSTLCFCTNIGLQTMVTQILVVIL